MIPVAAAAVPASFEKKVRRRGLDAISELVGEGRSASRRGPKRKATARYARREDIPTKDFPPYWREVLPELREAYRGLCAYLAMYLEPVAGSATVDHFIPRGERWELVYEWSNYRLAAGAINGRKSDRKISVDPFTLRAGTFELELVELQVVVSATATDNSRDSAEAVIEILGLNLPECCRLRSEYLEAYRAGDIKLSYLERRAPFLAQELRRQNAL